MVEQRPFKPLVGGSSPPRPTSLNSQDNSAGEGSLMIQCFSVKVWVSCLIMGWSSVQELAESGCQKYLD